MSEFQDPNTLLILIFNSLLIFGFHAITREGMIFGFWERFAGGAEIMYPISECVICMASLWGFGWHWLVIGLSWQMIPYMVILAGFNYMAVQFMQTGE